MRIEKFKSWLQANGYESTGIASRVSNAIKVDEIHGDLDSRYDDDRLADIIRKLSYSMEDERNNSPNLSGIPIQGDTRNGLATYKTAVNLYKKFRVEEGSSESTTQEVYSPSGSQSIPSRGIMNYRSPFKMPTRIKITGRSSSITNAFVNSIIPVVSPTEDEVKKALSILGMSHKAECCYCGDKKTEWDHLRPLVLNKKPTGYISEIQNLVPSCSKCNQSKGNKDWRKWIESDARLSPKLKGVVNLEERKQLLEEYEKWKEPTKMDFASIVGDEIWKKHWNNCTQIIEMMQESEETSEEIYRLIVNAYKKR